jgi:hypothetical protein
MAHDQSRSNGQKDVGKKANMHCRWESMGKKEAVILQKNSVVVKLGQKRTLNVGEKNVKQQKLKKDEARKALLECPSWGEERIKTLQERQKQQWLQDGPI